MSTAITVVIVNYNAGDYLIHCVGSVLTTTLPLEVWVVDNASSDQSLALLKAHFSQEPRLHILENPKNLGFSRANNQVISQTHSEYILLLNPDCSIPGPEVLSQMKAAMDAHPTAAMGGCLVHNRDGSIQPTCIRTAPTPWNSLVRVLHLHKILGNFKLFKGLDTATTSLPRETVPVEFTSGAFMFVRKTAIDEIGLMDENYFLYCEDTDWMLRFRQAGWQILFVAGVEITHAKGISSYKTPLQVLWYKHQSMWYFYCKFYAQHSPWILKGLVYGGIWLRFGLLWIVTLFRSTI
jgi:GT2 family glycosyltransferase